MRGSGRYGFCSYFQTRYAVFRAWPPYQRRRWSAATWARNSRTYGTTSYTVGSAPGRPPTRTRGVPLDEVHDRVEGVPFRDQIERAQVHFLADPVLDPEGHADQGG